MSYKVCLARQSGWNLESPEVGTWLFHFGFTVAQSQPVVEQVFSFSVVNHRVPLCRNMSLQAARDRGCSHILMLDPDMSLDRYVEGYGEGPSLPGAKRFWDVAWPFATSHPGSIVAAPYCGGHFGQPVHIFVRDTQNRLVRLSREKAAKLSGWHSVEAVGAGCMLMDMQIFQKLTQPYFHDTHTDDTHNDLRHSSDVEFSLKCRAVGVPIYVNFDCWAGHWQMTCTERPGVPPKTMPPVAELVSPDPSVPVLMESVAHGR